MSAEIFPYELEGSEEAIGISEVEHLASYNWIDSPRPVILVPGIPSLWKPPKKQAKLKKDSGFILIAQNAYRMPECPLEPLFRALFVQNPAFELHKIDLITDRNNLRKLLSFLQGKEFSSFAIRVELVQNTLVMNRKEARTFEIIEPTEFRGFGHEFEKAYTKNKFPESTGHHRIITYRFGDLRILLRHETDGYYGDEGIDDLLESLSLAEPKDPLTFDNSRLSVQLRGTNVPISSTLEIKTRVAHKPIAFEDVAPQLWFSQTQNLVRALHRHGSFEPCEVENVRAHIDLWEQKSQKDLSKLEHLLRRIRVLVQQSGATTLEFDVGRGSLVLTKPEKSKMLPDDLYTLWSNHDSTEKVVGGSQGKTLLVMDGIEYTLDVSGIPYLDSLERVNGRIIHGELEYFSVALHGFQSGYRECFRMMTVDLQEHVKLLDTYKLLQIDLLHGSTLSDVVEALILPEGYDELDGKAIPRDAAYKLLYLMYSAHSSTDTKSLNTFFAAVLFIVSHPRTFKSKTRIVMKTAYDKWFHATVKQQAQLQKWKQLFDPEQSYDAEESTDAEASEGFWSSDDS